MGKRRAKPRSRWLLILVLALAVVGLGPVSSASAGPRSDPVGVDRTSSKVGSARQAAADKKVTRGDLVRLSRRVRTVIRTVERAELSCDLQNALVRRLRLVDDGLRSGRPSGAGGMLVGWVERVHAVVSAGALSTPVAAELQQELPAILDEIGTGWRKNPRPVRNWPALPECDTSQDSLVGSDYQVWTPGDAEVVVETALKLVPKVGVLLSGLAGVLWPSDSPDVYTLIDEVEDAAAQNLAMTALQSLEQDLDDFNWLENERWYQNCVLTLTEPQCTQDKEALVQSYDTWVTNFRDHGVAFQQDPKFHVDLLPLYAQYENMYLSLLREGLRFGPEWGVNATNMDKYRKFLDEELDGTDTSRGIGYVDAVYTNNLPDPGTDADDWKTWNAYVRDMTLNVLDFRSMWPYMDPEAYPNGYPGLKHTRMLFSDPVGCYMQYPRTPANPEDLDWLQYLQVWEDNNTAELTYFDVIDSMQVYAPGLPAPPPIMGDSTPDGTSMSWSLSYWPLAFVDRIHYGEGETIATLDPQKFVQGLTLHFSNGSTATLGSYSDIFLTSKVHEGDFAYEDHVLANARIANIQYWSMYDDPTANCLVFGFRQNASY